MMDFARARRTMVDTQLRTADVTDQRVLDAFLEVPREAFVPADQASLAYLDKDLPIAPGRFLMQPMVLAKLLQAARPGPEDRALVVASGAGYSAAVLSPLVASVTALEEDDGLAARSREALAACPNVTVKAGALVGGDPAGGTYDVILIEGAVEEVPKAILGQLAEGGRLVTVVGFGRPGRATMFVRSKGDAAGRVIFDIVAPPLQAFARKQEFAF
jgi:protein-L-isoaspartate(D-aspartate) O-methyltransferase